MHFVEGVPLADYLGPAAPQSAPHTLDVYFDFSSPYAYLGASQAQDLARRTGATLRWRPILLGGLFRALGQVEAPLLAYSDAKREFTLRDLARWASYYGVPFRFPSVFPQRSLKALRCYLALPEARRDAFRDAVFRAAWGHDRDIDDAAVLNALIGDDAAAVRERAETPAVKDLLRDETNRAMARGVFGVPTWVVDERELFWGQDRIPLVTEALRR